MEYTKQDFVDMLYQVLYKTEEDKAMEEEDRKHGITSYPWQEKIINNYEIFSLLKMPKGAYRLSDKGLLKYEWSSQALHVALMIDKRARSVKADNFHLYIKDHLNNEIFEIRDGKIIYEQKGEKHE